MAKKTVKFTQNGIEKLANDKPVVYKILTTNDNNNYTGIAKKAAGAKIIHVLRKQEKTGIFLSSNQSLP